MQASTTNTYAGQLLAGERFKSHSNHPSEWIMVCRDLGAVKVRRADGHEAIIPLRTRLHSHKVAAMR